MPRFSQSPDSRKIVISINEVTLDLREYPKIVVLGYMHFVKLMMIIIL